jgi:hypothetical protein
MRMSSGIPWANVALTEADLARAALILLPAGRYCGPSVPFHDSHSQQNLYVQHSNGRFVCFACGTWGYMTEVRELRQDEQRHQAVLQRPLARRQRARSSRPVAAAGARCAVPANIREVGAERVAIMLAEGHLLRTDAAPRAWEGL